MPHRVTNFLRTTPGVVPHTKKTSPHHGARHHARNITPDSSDSEDVAPMTMSSVKMPDLEALKKHHRLSLPFGKAMKDHAPASSSKVGISWNIESPPLVFHGRPQDSTGALLSGQLFLDVREDMVDVERFTAKLRLHVTHRRPVQDKCQDCRNKITEIESWQFLAQPTTLRRGRHQYPFSVLLAGKLPATLATPLIQIDYEFSAEAFVIPCPVSGPAMHIKFDRNIMVKRAIPRPEMPHQSIRVFPPTNIKVTAQYNPVIHPSGANSVSIKLDGLTNLNEGAQVLEMWKLKKATWRLEEKLKCVAPACAKHGSDSAEGSQNGQPRVEERLLGGKQIQEGWKSNYGGNDGTVDLEFEYGMDQAKASGRDAKYACDCKTGDGTEVSHTLQLELMVSKEYASQGKPNQSTPTGTGRILRMHFSVMMTDYPGMGVSWDNESPPVYEDVPPSPPGYPCDDCPIYYESLEPLDSPRSSLSRLDSNSSDGSRSEY